MALILNIDTATETGSIALSYNESIISLLTNADQKDHAAWIHNAIDKMMNQAGRTLKELSAVAVTAGPGSYTGLRVGMATAKGLCYALNIPLITENTLKVMARAAVEAVAKGNAEVSGGQHETTESNTSIESDKTTGNNEPTETLASNKTTTTNATLATNKTTAPNATLENNQTTGSNQPSSTITTSTQPSENNHTHPSETQTLFCPMIDARRMEVFTALYTPTLQEIIPPQPMILDHTSFSTFLGQNNIIFFGSGSAKFKILMPHPHGSFTDIRHTAADLACLAQNSFMMGAFTDPAYAEPVYLKEFYTHTKK